MSNEDTGCGMRSAECRENILAEEWLALPTETEIYILPNGEIVVADLPVELIHLLESFSTEPSITDKTLP